MQLATMFTTATQDINMEIRNLANKAKIAIMEKNDKEFTEYTVSMLDLASHQDYKDMTNSLKDVIYETCYALNYDDQKKGYDSQRVDIANVFYNNIVECCRVFLN